MKKILIATFALSMMLGSCKKEDVTKVTPKEVETKDVSGSKVNSNANKPVYQPFTVVDGRAVFATTADFQNLMTTTKSKSKEDLINGWGTTCGYNTLLRTIESVSKNTPNISKMAMRGIEDESFAAILNDQGEVQLGDTIAKVIGDEEYIYHTSNATTVATTVSNAQINGTLETVGSQIATISGVRVRTTIVNLLPVTNGGGIRVACPPFTNVFTNTQDFSSSERSYFKFANRSYLFYATLNVVVDMERRLGGFWGWLFGWGHTNVTTTKEYLYSIQYRQNIGFNQTCFAQASGRGIVTRDPITMQLPTPINVVDTGTGVHRYNLDWAAGFGVWYNIKELNATLKNTYNGVNHTVLFQPCGQGCL